MKRPDKKDYLTCNQMEYGLQLDKYYSDLDKYCDYLENIMEEVIKDCHIDRRSKEEEESIPYIDPKDIESRSIM